MLNRWYSHAKKWLDESQSGESKTDDWHRYALLADEVEPLVIGSAVQYRSKRPPFLIALREI